MVLESRGKLSSNAKKISFLHNGGFWLRLWATLFVFFIAWGILTFFFWLDSVRNLNIMTVVGLWIACGAGVQATLAMRVADPKDQF
jgi:hypothetical protein